MRRIRNTTEDVLEVPMLGAVIEPGDGVDVSSDFDHMEFSGAYFEPEGEGSSLLSAQQVEEIAAQQAEEIAAQQAEVPVEAEASAWLSPPGEYPAPVENASNDEPEVSE